MLEFCVSLTGMRNAPMKLMGDGSASVFTTMTDCTRTHTVSLGNNSSVS